MAEKLIWPGSTQLAPVPAVLVGCGNGTDFKHNLITVAWAGIVCSTPPMVSVSIRPERYSRGLIESTGEFTINVPTTAMAEAVDYCGMVSGRDTDKFKAVNISAKKGSKVAAPIINECPLALECKVVHSLKLGSHIMYVGEVVAVQVDKSFVDERGKFDLAKADILGYAHGNYYGLGDTVGSFGFSIKKK